MTNEKLLSEIRSTINAGRYDRGYGSADCIWPSLQHFQILHSQFSIFWANLPHVLPMSEVFQFGAASVDEVGEAAIGGEVCVDIPGHEPIVSGEGEDLGAVLGVAEG
jgi:hypothetical protein